jgi:hypothetical protein
MSGNSPSFKWDEYGISAYGAHWYDSGEVSTIDNIDKNKFVRFDQYGIYGINDTTINGETWHPTGNSKDALAEIGSKATFALTWDGLKVSNSNKVVMRIGDGAKASNSDTDLLNVQKDGNTIFAIDENGSLKWSATSSPIAVLYTSNANADIPTKEIWDAAGDEPVNEGDWHKEQNDTDKFMS